ncbi:hypothetical protein EBAPG3_007090 [Nitrosospira lacus]|uniref:Uncharacterized protein n=1 Tax=Nitrosospira lacus TaxID=1288494 RepID=A0A1W6SP58_9PROT|nr:hypothetical protein [Nitrosospira lacus]ARO87552.1 hypothetical protein EBAPG3_007090 [Nitrosospira lacus]
MKTRISDKLNQLHADFKADTAALESPQESGRQGSPAVASWTNGPGWADWTKYLNPGVSTASRSID